jgi:8-oxo-dGTP diphosphatase
VTNYRLPTTNYRYQLIPRVLCFVTSGDDLLLLKGAPDKKLWAGKYNGLGGHVERGESVPTAARREIQEEAGIGVTNLRLRGVVTVDLEAEPGIGLFVFTARALTRDTTASTEGGLAWVPISRVAALDTVEDLPRLVAYVFSLPADAPPFGGHYRYDRDGRLVMEFFSEPVGADRPL